MCNIDERTNCEMREHNCRNLGGYNNGDTVKINGMWILCIEDDYYNIEIKNCPYCGIELK